MKENQVYKLAQIDRDSIDITTGRPLKSYRYSQAGNGTNRGNRSPYGNAKLSSENLAKARDNGGYLSPKVANSIIDSYRPWVP